ncbi:EPM2AIP1 [Cordylochernes scorpioides]|uniref:EPM2AIP1 n=1 Tax=Cordylochernes scorpioides TaxID=51811 RepID=A0ABY6KKF3_9ARAC|nr:EPM2AIP1 [Cordylochernes scorpioides]
MEKKRKIDSECRKFKDQWNIQYFVIESSNKALCLICNESKAVLKEYNMKRHYETKHSQNYSKYTGIVRTEKFEALKRGLKSQQSLFTKVKTEQEAATRASFRVALEIAKRGKPFTDGEMIKECIIAVVEEMCPEKVNLLKTLSMSANTVARRVENIAENISSQLFDKNGHVEWFSLALDESTDVLDTAQVLIYIRGVDKSYEVHEELLDMYSIHGTTTGVVALVSKAVENDGGSKPLVLHCIIHQQSLCEKCLDMSDVLKPVISTVNFIRSFGLNHRQFRQFIAEIGETDLPYHTAVRWLSCGKVLQRFFELRALAVYVDLTKHVNELNLRLQGENQHLPDLYTNIKSFRMKLILFQSQLRSKCFSHFKTCEIFSHTTETEFPIDFAIETLSALKINFDTRFSDFDAIANQIKIFQNPFDADIETLAPELQMEMIDLQCSDIIKNKYENSSLLEFYKSLPLTQFDNLHKFARGLFSVFGFHHRVKSKNIPQRRRCPYRRQDDKIRSTKTAKQFDPKDVVPRHPGSDCTSTIKSWYRDFMKSRNEDRWKDGLNHWFSTATTQWCRERSTWNCADWGRIVFSDKSRFLLCPDDCRKRVWRRPGQRVDPGRTVEHHTGPQQGVMVWCDISFDIRTPLRSRINLTPHNFTTGKQGTGKVRPLTPVGDNLRAGTIRRQLGGKISIWKIEVYKADREKTAFITLDGLYVFLVMPFGLSNDPATFERMMDKIFKGLKWKMTRRYLHDTSWAVMSEPVLAYFEEQLPTELHIDASGYGIGAVLVQINDRKDRSFGFASRTLSKSEKRITQQRKKNSWPQYGPSTNSTVPFWSLTTAYHSQMNGLTERLNKTLENMLAIYVGVEQRDWDVILSYVAFG